jgi:hypothetical protein
VSKSKDRLYKGTYVDYKDRNGNWHVGCVAKVDDTRNKEAIVVICSKSRELQFFPMSSKSTRLRMSRLGVHTASKKDDLLQYSNEIEEAEVPEDVVAKYHNAILGKRRSDFNINNQPEILWRRRNPKLKQTKDLHRRLLLSLQDLYTDKNNSKSNSNIRTTNSYNKTYEVGKLIDFFCDDSNVEHSLDPNVINGVQWRPAKIIDVEETESNHTGTVVQKKLKIHVLGTSNAMDTWVDLPNDEYKVSEFMSRTKI